MSITKWRQGIGVDKVVSIVTAQIFLDKNLINGQTYTIPDLHNENKYYTIDKDNNGKVRFAHTDYGLFKPALLDLEGVEKEVYKARKSINAYFFS